MGKWQILLEENKLKFLFHSIGLDPAILIITVIKIDKTPPLKFTEHLWSKCVLNVIQKYDIKNNGCIQLILSFNTWNSWNARVKYVIAL